MLVEETVTYLETTSPGQLAWQVERLDGVPVRRVWLHTSSRDNPHAKPNDERRGFRPFRTEQRQREVWT